MTRPCLSFYVAAVQGFVENYDPGNPLTREEKKRCEDLRDRNVTTLHAAMLIVDTRDGREALAAQAVGL